MKLKDKKAILAYLEGHNDGSETATRLIHLMKIESNYSDCDVFSVCVDDLDDLSESAKEKLRGHFGKAEGEDWTAEECEEVAERLADYVSEDYSENLYNTIEYEF